MDRVGDDVLVEVFRDGELIMDWTFEQIREKAALPPYGGGPSPD